MNSSKTLQARGEGQDTPTPRQAPITPHASGFPAEPGSASDPALAEFLSLVSPTCSLAEQLSQWFNAHPVKEGHAVMPMVEQALWTHNRYDGILDVTSFKELLEGHGWFLYTRLEHAFDTDSDNDEIPAMAHRVAVQGVFNRGKTWLLNFLADEGQEQLPTGFVTHTRGISVRVMRKAKGKTDQRALLFVDSAGVSTTVEEKKDDPDGLQKRVRDKSALDCFIREVVHMVADFRIVVVSQMTFEDQVYLKELRRSLGEKQEAFIVHNLKDVSSTAEFRKAMTRFERNSHKLRKTRLNGFWYYQEDQSPFAHIFLARHDSEAGKTYNHIARKILLILSTSSRNMPVADIWTDIQKAAQELLQKKYLVSGKTDKPGTHVGWDYEIQRVIEIRNQGVEAVETQVKFHGDTPVMSIWGGTRERKAAGKSGDGGFDPLFFDHFSLDGPQKKFALSPFVNAGKYGSSLFFANQAFNPQVDISRRGDPKSPIDTITLDLPGVSKRPEVTVEGVQVRIVGQRKNELPSSDSYELQERRFGGFDISVKLPSNNIVKSQEEVREAVTFSDGIFTIYLNPSPVREDDCLPAFMAVAMAVVLSALPMAALIVALGSQ